MSYVTKNYTEQGGEKTVINGTLEIASGATLDFKNGATVNGLPPAPEYSLPAASAAALGGVRVAANQADSTAADVAGLVTDFNTLLAKLKTAGIIAADAV